MMLDINDIHSDQLEPDIRSEKLTNRSIHTIKKFLMREEAYDVTPDQLIHSNNLS